jgi:PIN domain nuclease of toxin-antitoxin system
VPNFVTDTHSLIWYLTNSLRLSPAASAAFDSCDRGEATIFVPTMCLVEIVFLQEKGRIPADLKAKLDTVLKTGTSGLVVADLTAEVAEAVAQIPGTDVPDMPDRIIAATALYLGIPLVSRDRAIQASKVTTIW